MSAWLHSCIKHGFIEAEIREIFSGFFFKNALEKHPESCLEWRIDLGILQDVFVLKTSLQGAVAGDEARIRDKKSYFFDGWLNLSRFQGFGPKSHLG